MTQRAYAIHIVCHKDKNVIENDGGFKSGWWRISEKQIRQGVLFFLHEHMAELSYRYGMLTGEFEFHPNKKGFVRVTVDTRKALQPDYWPKDKQKAQGRAYNFNLPALRSQTIPGTAKANGIRDLDIGTDFPDRAERVSFSFDRDDRVRTEVLSRAKGGACELCGRIGFRTSKGRHYLETHHIIALSNGGTDRPWNVIALCPEHHREAHFGEAAEVLEAQMIERMKAIEPRLAENIVALESDLES